LPADATQTPGPGSPVAAGGLGRSSPQAHRNAFILPSVFC